MHACVDNRLIEEIRRPDGRLSKNIQANIIKAVTKLQEEADELRRNKQSSFDVIFEHVPGGSFALTIVVSAVVDPLVHRGVARVTGQYSSCCCLCLLSQTDQGKLLLSKHGKICGMDATHLTNSDTLQLTTIMVQLDDGSIAPAAMLLLGTEDQAHLTHGLFMLAETVGPSWTPVIFMVDDAFHEMAALKCVFGGTCLLVCASCSG